jgi:signal transduction histidine kinase
VNPLNSIIDKLLPEGLKRETDERQWIRHRLVIGFCAFAAIALLVPLRVQYLDPLKRERSYLLLAVELSLVLLLTIRWHRIKFEVCVALVVLTASVVISSFSVYGQFSMFTTANLYGAVLVLGAVYFVSIRFAFFLIALTQGALLWIRYKYEIGDFQLIQPDPGRYWRALQSDSVVANLLVLGMAWISTNIHAALRRKVGEALELAAHEKHIANDERRKRAMAELASGVAHEMNNPLTIINGRAFLIKGYFTKRGEKIPGDIEESVHVISETVVRMTSIVATMRLLTEPVPPDQNPTPVSTLVEKAIGDFQTKLTSHGIKAQIENRTISRPTLQFGSAFIRVLSELLDNAIAAAKDSAGKTIIVEVSEDDQNVKVTIKDSGPGITLADPQTIFDPFVTTKNPGEGPGLGLAVARALAEKSGLTLALTKVSNPTTFEITAKL